jgi:outer membrane protein OmpA-like peptidoglycan-associated protein
MHEGSLYFSSDIFYGLGGMDIYKSNLETEETFSIPVNVGKGINSEADDFGLILKEDEKKGLLGYFASNRPGGMGKDDIYGFTTKQPPGLRTVALKGKVVNISTNKGVLEAQIRLTGKDGTVIKEIFASADGDFRIEIPWQDEITIQSTKVGHSVFTATYTEAALEEVQKSSLNIEIAALEDIVGEVEGKTVLDIEKFFFARNRSDLTPEITVELNKVIDAISKFPKLQIRIETHTDSRGSGSTNKRLSQKRAEALRNYLLANGASSTNILEAIGYGEDRIMNNCTNGVYCLDFLHEQNIRTLFVVTNFEELQ